MVGDKFKFGLQLCLNRIEMNLANIGLFNIRTGLLTANLAFIKWWALAAVTLPYICFSI